MLYKSIRYLTKRRGSAAAAPIGKQRRQGLRSALLTALAVSLVVMEFDSVHPVFAQSQTPLFILQDAGTIRSVNLDGTSLTDVTTSPASARGIAVSGDKIYWVEASSIKSVAHDGTGLATVVSGLSSARAVAVHGDKLYWLESGAVKTSALDGTSVTTVVSDGDLTSYSYGAITVTDDKVYYSMSRNRVAPKLKSVNIDGSSLSTLYTGDAGLSRGANHVSATQVSGSRIYGALVRSTEYSSNRSNLSVLSWDLTGGDQQTLSISMTDGNNGAYFPADSVGLALSHDSNVLYAGGPFGSIIQFNLSTNASTTLVTNSGLRGQYLALLSESSIPILKVTGKTETTVILDWDDIEDATDYQYRYKTSADSNWGDPVTVTESTALVSGLISGTAYDFQVRSREGVDESNWSATVSATPSPRELSISRWPARVGGLTVVSEGTDAVQLLWQHQVNAAGYEIGLWEAGQILALSLIQGATETITNPAPWTQIIESVGVSGGATYGKFDENRPYVGIYADDPAKLLMLQHRRYSGDILYYWNTELGRWRVLRCKTPANADNGCDYGTPASNDAEVLLTISSSVFSWHILEDGPPDWAGLYLTEADALESVKSAGDRVIFRDALGFTRYAELLPTTPSAIVTGLPAGRQYISVRGITSDGREGEWANLATVGAVASSAAPVAGAPVTLAELIYTDEVPNIEHYLRDETTLILNWQNLPGARHYDVRTNSKVTRIETLAGSAQQTALSLASLQGQTVDYQVRAVIETGILDVRVRDSEGALIYVVPPNSVAYSRWSAARSVNVEQLGMISGPGTGSLLEDPGPPDDIVTGLIADILKISTLLEEDADDGDVQVWTLPLGLLGSIFLGGLTGLGAGRGRLDKAAIVAGGLVFFVCWAYLCPVYLHIPWPAVFAVIVPVVGAGLVILINDWLR